MHLPNKDSPVPIPVCTVREIAPLGEGPLRFTQPMLPLVKGEDDRESEVEPLGKRASDPLQLLRGGEPGYSQPSNFIRLYRTVQRKSGKIGPNRSTLSSGFLHFCQQAERDWLYSLT
jgi:hypothetical protein